MTEAAETGLIKSADATGCAARASGRAIRNGCVSLVLVLLTALAVVQTTAAFDASAGWGSLARAMPRALVNVLTQAVIGFALAVLVDRHFRRVGLWVVLALILVALYPTAIGSAGLAGLHIGMWSPFILLLTLAAMNAIPNVLYEAAAVDRAGWWFTFRTITLPLVAAPMLLGVTFLVVNSFRPPDARRATVAYALLIGAIVVGSVVAHSLNATRSRR